MCIRDRCVYVVVVDIYMFICPFICVVYSSVFLGVRYRAKWGKVTPIGKENQLIIILIFHLNFIFIFKVKN